jgi:hypothetical protein
MAEDLEADEGAATPDAEGRASAPSAAPQGDEPRAPQRRSRRSEQSRRSERAYGRPSGVPAGRQSAAMAGQGGPPGGLGGFGPGDGSADLDDLDWEVEQRGGPKPWYRRRLFWKLAPLALSVLFIIGGALYLT